MNWFYKVALLFVTIYIGGCSSINSFLSTDGVVSDPSSNSITADRLNPEKKGSGKPKSVAVDKQDVVNIPAHAEHEKIKLAGLYYRLALLYQQKEEYNKAVIELNKTLKIDLVNLGKNHRRVGTIYSMLGTIYYKKRKYSLSLTHFKKSVAVARSQFRKNDIKSRLRLSSELGNIGLAYWKSGELDSAIKSLKEAQQISAVVKKQPKRKVANRYIYLGLVYWKKKNYKLAISNYLKAVEIEKRLLGKDHYQLTKRYANLGLLFRLDGNAPKSIEYYSLALVLEQKEHGDHHNVVANRYSDLAAIYRRSGNIKKAISTYQKVVTIRSKHLGKQHPKTVAIQKRISMLKNQPKR